jgi:hypothetical protein
MQTTRAIRMMVIRAYCKPLVGMRIITIASMVQRIVAPRVRNDETRDVKLVLLNQNLILSEGFSVTKQSINQSIEDYLAAF